MPRPKPHPDKEAALALLAPHVFSAEDGLDDPRVREIVASVFSVWIACLLDPSGYDGGVPDFDALDDAMLPPYGTTDEKLDAIACPAVSGGGIRAALRSLKATLPPGEALPDPVRAFLASVLSPPID